MATQPDRHQARQNANQHSDEACHIIIYIYMACVLSHSVEVKVTPAEKLRVYESLTIAPEHMDVQLLKEVHDERVDLRQQPHKEDDGKTQSEYCRENHKGTK